MGTFLSSPQGDILTESRHDIRGLERDSRSQMKLPVLICVVCFLGLKLLVRRVWYREECLRPGYLRHSLVIHSVDFVANLLLAAIIFMMLNTNTHRWLRTGVATAVLVGCDVALREFFLHLEARRLCLQSPRWTLQSAKGRLKDRLKRETPY